LINISAVGQKNRGRKKKIFFRPLFFVDAFSATEAAIYVPIPAPRRVRRRRFI
jgi:hypothetical protein